MVTGGSRGIGLGAARALGESGARVILVARSGEALARAADELKAAGVEALSQRVILNRRRGLLAGLRDACASLGCRRSW